MKRFLFAFALLLALVPAGPAAASRNLTYGDLDQRQRIALIGQLVERGDFERAQAFLSASRFDEAELGYVAAFLQARVFRATGRPAEAEMLLRKIVAERPAYDRVRLELAALLSEQGNREGATFHLKVLADSAADEGSRERFESFIDRIDPKKPFTWGAFVSIAPSTNINNGSSRDTILLGGLPFRIDPGGRAKSGLGLRAGSNAAYTYRFSENLSAYLAGSAVISKYTDARFDTLTGDLRLGLRHAGIAHMIGAELIADRRWIAWKPTDHGFGARLFARKPLAPRLQLSGEAQFVERRYDHDPAFRTRTFSGHARLDYSYATGRSVHLRAGAVDESMPARPHNSYRGTHLEIGTFQQLPFNFLGSLALRVGQNDYRADFPGSTVPRRDRYFEARASLLKTDLAIAGFAPRLGLTYYRQKSNVALYDHHRYGADLTFTKEF